MITNITLELKAVENHEVTKEQAKPFVVNIEGLREKREALHNTVRASGLLESAARDQNMSEYIANISELATLLDNILDAVDNKIREIEGN